jgi:hypothetical protein
MTQTNPSPASLLSQQTPMSTTSHHILVRLPIFDESTALPEPQQQTVTEKLALNVCQTEQQATSDGIVYTEQPPKSLPTPLDEIKQFDFGFTSDDTPNSSIDLDVDSFTFPNQSADISFAPDTTENVYPTEPPQTIKSNINNATAETTPPLPNASTELDVDSFTYHDPSADISFSSDMVENGVPAEEIQAITNSTNNTVENTALPQPSSTLSPTIGPDGCPQLDLSVSTASSVSSVSGQSTSSRLSENGAPSKKRGYMRPQATNFSESAKSRESVMSLGSIAHLQYYFARTGLLDGKGGQFAKKNTQFKIKTDGLRSTSLNLPSGSNDMAISPTTSEYPVSEGGLAESPMEGDDAQWDRELAMLPPTVSTYNQKPAYVQPPPDLTMLRRELTEALEDALKVLKESDKGVVADETDGWYEIQGLHLLDITTLAIRAAKNYYTAHSQYQRLHAIKSERAIRQELYQVLEILKRMATRNFSGGLRQGEKVGILTWIVGISELIQTEIDQEKKETEERERWSWRNGDWTGREREREHAFIKCFIEDPDSLPEWTPPPATTDPLELQQPTAFLQYFQSGLQLVHLHNTLVKKSQRSFEVIEKFHTDINKPYRCAENLRFWVKAAELRWDILLKVDVMAVVQCSSMDAWRQFDDAVLKWCTGVREEFIQEMSEARNANGKRTPPRLRVERDESGHSIRSPSIPDVTMDQSIPQTLSGADMDTMATIITSS